MNKVVGIDSYYSNSCYMNSGLQLLFHSPRLIRFFIMILETGNENLLPNNIVLLRFLKLIGKYKYHRFTKGFNSISKRNFYRSYIRRFDHFGWETQEDAQEFLVQFLDCIHEGFQICTTPTRYFKKLPRSPLLKIRNTFPKLFPKNEIITSKVYQLFGITSLSTVHCPNCKNISQRIDLNDTFLTVPFPQNIKNENSEKSDIVTEHKEEEEEEIEGEGEKANKVGQTSPIASEKKSVKKPKNEKREVKKKEEKTQGWFSYISESIYNAVSTTITYINPFAPSVKYLYGNKGCKISTCLNHYFDVEILDSSYQCEKCKKRGGQEKKVELLNTSEYLLFSIKRFLQNRSEGMKIADKLHFGEILDLRKYFHEFEEYDEMLYQCIGVLNHYGSMETGHYASYIKSGNDWHLCDDESVEDVEKEIPFCSKGYVLLYRKYSVKKRKKSLKRESSRITEKKSPPKNEKEIDKDLDKGETELFVEDKTITEEEEEEKEDMKKEEGSKQKREKKNEANDLKERKIVEVKKEVKIEKDSKIEIKPSYVEKKVQPVVNIKRGKQ